MLIRFFLLSCLLVNANFLLADTYQDIEATTSKGDKVILHPNGGWEFLDTKKAVEANAIASQHPENQICPKGAQRANFGYGRCILPSDKDYNRGSLGGKGKF
jgi:hypothetical protein